MEFLEEVSKLPILSKNAMKLELKEEKDKAFAHFQKVKKFQEAYQGKEMMIFDGAWKPLTNLGTLSPESLGQALIKSSKTVDSKKHQFENFIYEYKLVGFAFYSFLFSFVILLIPWKKKELGFNCFVFFSFFVQLIIVLLRTLYLERAPIANMYETVLVSAPFSIMVGLFMFKKSKTIFRFSALYALGCMGTAYFSTGMLNSEMENIMPVLRDNFLAFNSCFIDSFFIFYFSDYLGCRKFCNGS